MSSADQRTTREQEGERPSLSQVGKLLLYDELLVLWATEDPSRVPLFKKVYGCVGRLESETGWHLEVLLQQLGCDTAKEDFDEKLTPRRLAMCTEYMEWVEELLEDFDLQVDKRLILKGASRFYNAAGEDLSLVKEIMAEDGEPTFYLSLGENAQAWKAATRRLTEPAGDRAREIHRSNPLVDEATPHISPQRLEMLRSEECSELLGDRVAERMHEHISACSRCGRAWSRLTAGSPDIGSVGVLR